MSKQHFKEIPQEIYKNHNIKYHTDFKTITNNLQYQFHQGSSYFGVCHVSLLTVPIEHAIHTLSEIFKLKT